MQKVEILRLHTLTTEKTTLVDKMLLAGSLFKEHEKSGRINDG